MKGGLRRRHIKHAGHVDPPQGTSAETNDDVAPPPRASNGFNETYNVCQVLGAS